MGELPLHPAIVHIPLVLALVIPVLATALAWALFRGKLARQTWLAVLALQALVVGAAVMALRTGEQEEERVEDRIAEARIEAHEERAQVFTWAAGGVLVLAVAAYAIKKARPSQALMAATALGSVLVLGLGLRVGHAGGGLVYGAGGLTAPGGTAPAEAAEGGGGGTGEAAEAAEGGGGGTGEAAEGAEGGGGGTGEAAEGAEGGTRAPEAAEPAGREAAEPAGREEREDREEEDERGERGERR